MKYATTKTIIELELMFELTEPTKLLEHLHLIFFQWLGHLKQDGIPENIGEISEDIYFLLRFLEQAQKNSKE